MKLDENKVQSFFKIIKEEKIRTVFQPIVSLETGEAVAYEALSRITLENTGITIDKLFDMANQLGQVWNLEKLCRRKALERAAKKPGNCKLFLNVDCNVIMDQEFVCGFTREFLKKFDLKTEDLVFELTERTSVEAEKMFLRTVEHYKTQGFEIAIDDAGTGYSNLNRISYVEPHYIKIDMGLIRNIHLSKSKSSMVRVINHFCREMNMIAIAEGVETEEELQAVIKLGVSYAQGYFFQRPQDTFCTISDEKKEKLAEIRKKVQDYNYVPSFLGTIESLASVGCTISPDRKASEAYELFEKNEELLEICVVDEEGYFCGILTRQDVLKQFGGRYGFTLNQKHTVASIMRKDTLAVDYHFSVENVSKIAMERPIKEIYDAVVVLNEGRYYAMPFS
ncbi:MAG: EAL domain-containing protein [Clostridia bacterium]|nr:EAL domain-containing protein [Clostridia bacterium]